MEIFINYLVSIYIKKHIIYNNKLFTVFFKQYISQFI